MNSRLSRNTPKNNLAFTGEIALSTPTHATPLTPFAESQNFRRMPPPPESIKSNQMNNVRRNFIEPDSASDKINKELNEIQELLERKKNQRLGIATKVEKIEVEPPAYILRTDNVKSTLSRTTNVTSTKNMVAPIQTDYLTMKFNAKEEVKKPRNLNPQETKSQPQLQPEKFSNLLIKHNTKKEDPSDKKPTLFTVPSNLKSQSIAKNNISKLNSESQKTNNDPIVLPKQINLEKSKNAKVDSQEPMKNQKIPNSKVVHELQKNGKVGGQITENQKNSKVQELPKSVKENSKNEKTKSLKEEPEEVIVITEVGEMKLILCQEGCGRRFNEKALVKHEKVCKKVFQEKREVFDSAGTRVIELKDENEKTDEKESIKEEKNKGWEKKSEAFRNVIRATKNQFFQPEKEKKGKGKGK